MAGEQDTFSKYVSSLQQELYKTTYTSNNQSSHVSQVSRTKLKIVGISKPLWYLEYLTGQLHVLPMFYTSLVKNTEYMNLRMRGAIRLPGNPEL